MPIIRNRVLLSACLILIGASSFSQVDFPGLQPGKPYAFEARKTWILGNSVIEQSWGLSGDSLQPLGVTNKLTGQSFSQRGKRLFGVGLQPSNDQKGVYVGIRLDGKHLVALASKDGLSWTEMATFPREKFSGTPSLIRIGKLNLHAEIRDNPGDIGPAGVCTLSEFSVDSQKANVPDFEIKAHAHQGFGRELHWNSRNTFISCHIDKGTDQGMSWGPALALVWPDPKKFLLVGVRDSKPTLNVTTQAGEQILDSPVSSLPVIDLPSSSFRLVSGPKSFPIVRNPKSGRVAETIGGQAIEAEFLSAKGVRVNWRAELRDGSNYIRQTFRFSSSTKEIPLYGLELWDLSMPELIAVGRVPGCPIAGNGMFAGVELPGTRTQLDSKGGKIAFSCQLTLTPSQAYTFASVTGVAPQDQLRRSFLYYIERERARASSPFLHYNCWYDLGYTVDANKIVQAATDFNREFVKKRGVSVRSYLVDDGWDDPSKGLWKENEKTFPGGFAALRQRLQPLGAHLGIWISPLGGYGEDTERTVDAQALGIIPPGAKLDLSYPKYKEWFQNRCIQLIKEDGVNAFKWDRAGDGVSPHFMALLDIANELRKVDPKVFINVTVGTWPSPFWLNHVDSTWRMGSADVGWTGKGDIRNRWLNFRDGYCKRLFVDASPLYPLNSVMHHGIVNGRFFQGEPLGSSKTSLKNEARSYFANGTSLQELYLTPSLMTSESWDDVAEAAKWAHSNADVLVDAHWIGGDPLASEVYGYAAWSKRKGTLMLRNPSDQTQHFTIDIEKQFELPSYAARTYQLKSPYRDQRVQSVKVASGKPSVVHLEPFEVMVFDAWPD